MRRSRIEPMALGSIPATKPVFFPSFLFFSLLVNTLFFFYCNIIYKIKTAASTCTHRLPLPHSSLIVYLTSAWVRAYCNLRNEMERNEVKICSLRNENPLEGERRLQIQREQRRRRRQQETAEQKKYRLAQRRQPLQQETEEQEIGIRGIMIVLHCRKPRFLSLLVSSPIYRSKSAKIQLCITARRITIFRRTARGHICSLFLSFSKSGSRNNAKSAFQYTVNNNTT